MNKVAEILKARGIKHSWLAKQLNVGNTQFSRMLSGERPFTEKNIEKTCQILQLPRNILFGNNDTVDHN